MRRRGTGRDDGFTMTEVMVVVLILSVLVMIAFATYDVADGRARQAECLSNQRICEDAVLTYRVANDGAMPATLDVVEPYIRGNGGQSVCTEDAALELAYDPVTGQVTCANHPGP
jgi:prepilin-type N-terminal cleavage/methylation domain-containing protein